MRRRYWFVLIVAALLPAAVRAQAAPQAPSIEHARMLFDAGQMNEARRELEALEKAGVKDPQLFLLLGVTQRNQGDVKEAIATLRKGRALAPESEQLAMEMATTRAMNHELDTAAALFRQELVRNPANKGARVGLAFVLAWQGRHDEARVMFDALVKEDPKDISAWIGVGFVARAALRRSDAIAAYQRVLEIHPGNDEAIAALEELRWDRRSESRVLGGQSSDSVRESAGEARVDSRYALTPRTTLTGGFQHYAFGAVSAITSGGYLVGSREENSLEGGVTHRPSNRTTLSLNLYTFFSDEGNRGVAWATGVHGVTRNVSLLANFRPSFSSRDPSWLFAGAVGVVVSLPHKQALTARVLVAGDTVYEPRTTIIASYDLARSRRVGLRIGAEHSGTNEQFKYNAVSAGGTYLFTPSFGLQVDGSIRTGTHERSTLMFGGVLRR